VRVYDEGRIIIHVIPAQPFYTLVPAVEV
jgi:hypothetical protein